MSADWVPFHGSPRSFSGTRLEGDRRLRFAYLDEAGTDRKARRIVVAGVMVNADRQWRSAQQALHELSQKWLPDLDPRNVIFHVKDVMNGAKDFERYKNSDERVNILRDLARIPSDLALPIVYGFLDKEHEGVREWESSPPIRKHYSLAFGLCLVAVETYMRAFGSQGEVANIIAEDLAEVKADARRIQRVFSRPDEFQRWFAGMTEMLQPGIPLNHVVDTVHYTAKADAPLLQIADACSYILSRWLNGWGSGAGSGDAFYELLAGRIRPTIDPHNVGGGFQVLVPKSHAPSFVKLGWEGR